MRNLFISSILILIFCVVNFPQTNETSPCPTINLLGPAGISDADEPIVFTAALSKEAEKFNLKYVWTVSTGEIAEGQGTLALKVLQKDFHETLTASLEIIGLPKQCESTASVSVYICRPLNFVQIEEFSIPASQIDKVRLDNLLNELQNQPATIAYIFERFERKISQNTIERKVQKIADYLIKEKGIEKDRFIISIAESDKNLTQYFIVPPDAPSPKIEDYD
jgi:hypothetical protein